MSKSGTIIIVDDNKGVLTALQILLKNYFSKVVTLSSPVTLSSVIREEAPEVILLDEPTSFFDERTEKAFVEQLARWAGERTLIIATHKAAVLNIVDRILVIQDGQLALDKPKATVFEQEKARAQVVNI